MIDEEDETPNMSEARTTSTVEVSKAVNPSDDPSKNLEKPSEEIITKKLELIPFAHVKKNHPASSIIVDPSAGMQTRKKEKIDFLKMAADLCYTSTIEPSTIDSTLKDEYWLNVMQEELLQFRGNNVWTLVAQGYNQVEGVDFDETFALVAQLEAIRLLLAISCIHKFKLYQMDVKSAFLNGYLNEEVYVAQPKGFVDSEHLKHVYKLNKALYGLKQAPRAWYERLTIYLRSKGYSRGEINKTLFIHRESDQLLSEFDMSMVGELSYFLGLQIKQKNDGIFISQEKYAKNMIKKFGLEQARNKRTPVATHVKLRRDTDGAEVDHKLYWSIIGSLLYLIASRPDISYVVGICARYQADLRISHLEAVKRILKMFMGPHSEDAPNVSISSPPPEQQVRVRGRRFKSTPPRRPYRLPSEKLQGEASRRLHESLQPAFVPEVGPLHSQAMPSDFSPSVQPPRSKSPASKPNAVPVHIFGNTTAAHEEQTGVSQNEDEFASFNQDDIPSEDIPPTADDPTAHQLKEGQNLLRVLNLQKEKLNKKFMVQRRIADEVNISDKHQSCMSIMDLIQRAGLEKTILKVGPFYPQLIREFIVNLPDEFNNPSSPDYHTVHIRGFKFVISPAVINGFLGNVVDINYSPSYPSIEVLTTVLSGGTLSTWLVNGLLIL
ncbi:gag-pol polyprotein [Cucumis melo var. makuwa]|uniref:Gag-pol polyprotein n=1 Tax=Cucumis melo var. makuwa TaxID=1194695 RepID=A0A5A7VKW1_CUCMM|nr:gag-pol polyprotein [Cucumis melo var. makuwa]TYK31541.1 gag-pol polyprotein [Cucumis melo var. makuwa]